MISSFTQEWVEAVNKTSRSGGAIGGKAIVPRLVTNYADSTSTILDFGAGKKAIHAQNLKEQGYDVTAYEFGGNVDPLLHDSNALERKYDIVYASDVLNVQLNEGMFWDTLGQVVSAMRIDSILIANYPASPRKWGVTGQEIRERLERVFSSVEIIHGGLLAPVFLCKP